MAEPLACPKCAALLTDAEVIRLHRQYAAAQRKTKAGGHNGGRPPKCPERGIAGQPAYIEYDPRRGVSGFRCPNGCALAPRNYRLGDQCITCLALLVPVDSERVLIPIEEL